MRGLLFLLLTCTVSMALADDPPRIFSHKDDDDKTFWIEVSLPISKNGGFGDALGDSKTGSRGLQGYTLAWEPYVHNPSQGKWVTLFRNVGFTGNVTVNNNDPRKMYDTLIAESYKVLNPFEVSSTCGGTYVGGPQCVGCLADGTGIVRTCVYEAIYGRVTPIKYSRGSLSFGAYVPKKYKKLLFQAGGNVRMHLTREGMTTDNLKNSAETTLAATVRVAYPVPFLGMTLSSGYEKSLLGTKSGPKQFRYQQFQVGVTLGW